MFLQDETIKKNSLSKKIAARGVAVMGEETEVAVMEVATDLGMLDEIIFDDRQETNLGFRFFHRWCFP